MKVTNIKEVLPLRLQRLHSIALGFEQEIALPEIFEYFLLFNMITAIINDIVPISNA